MFCMKSLEVLHLRDVLFDKLFGHENYSAALSDLPGLTSAACPYEMKCKIQGFVGTSSFSDGCQSSLSIYPMLWFTESRWNQGTESDVPLHVPWHMGWGRGWNFPSFLYQEGLLGLPVTPCALRRSQGLPRPVLLGPDGHVSVCHYFLLLPLTFSLLLPHL